MKMYSRLQNLPISFFSTIMGLSGLAIALQRAGDLWSPSAGLGNFVALLTMLAFIVLVLIYALKAMRYPTLVIAELSDPVKMSFGATVTVSLVLLSITTLHLAPMVSKALWVAGAPLHLAYTLYALGYLNVYSMVDGFEGGKAKDGAHKGARVVDGWKNAGLPWGWKLEKDVVYGLNR